MLDMAQGALRHDTRYCYQLAAIIVHWGDPLEHIVPYI
jgi:hypothetical protein